MTRIVLVSSSRDFHEQFHLATAGAFMALAADPLPPDPATLVTWLNGAPPPDIIVIEPMADPRPALELAAMFDAQAPSTAVILVSDQEESIGLHALRSGVRDILHPDSDAATIQRALDRAVNFVHHVATAVAGPPPPPPVVPTGKVINVMSPKGGVGKTTVATNLAVGLALAEPSSTVLVDLDVQFGDVATALNLSPEYTLLDAVSGPASHDTMALKTFLTLHETGLYTICGVDSPASADSITSDQVGRLLQMLASTFRYVVVDTAPGLSEHTLAALDQTTDPIVLTSMDVAGVRGLRKELEVLAKLDVGTKNRRVVLNFCDPRGGLSIADVTATIGVPVDLELPLSSSVLPSQNQGIPLLQQGNSKDPVAKQLRWLVSQYSQSAPMAPRGRHARELRREKAVVR